LFKQLFDSNPHTTINLLFVSTFGDVEMLNQIIYSTKPAAYQMQLTVIKGDLIKEDTRVLKDANYVRDVTLESVMDDYRNIFESLHTQNKAPAKGSVMLLATQPPKGNTFPKQFKKSCSLCGKQGHKSIDCFSRPENAHKKPGFKLNEKALTTTTPTSKNVTHLYLLPEIWTFRKTVLQKEEL
jgi:hypothetical protein